MLGLAALRRLASSVFLPFPLGTLRPITSRNKLLPNSELHGRSVEGPEAAELVGIKGVQTQAGGDSR
jgi:hypothetical protein